MNVHCSLHFKSLQLRIRMLPSDGSEVLQLTRWRDNVLYAFAWGQTSVLDRLAVKAVSLAPSADELLLTGVGKVLDSQVWAGCTKSAQESVATAITKWKTSAKRRAPCQGPSCPGLLKKPKLFKDTAVHFGEWLRMTEHVQPGETDAQAAAFAFSIRGFENWRQLEGLVQADLVGWSKCPRVQAMIVRSVARVNSGTAGEPGSTASGSETLVLSSKTATSSSVTDEDARTFSDAVTPQALAAREKALMSEKELMSLEGLGVSLGPQEAIASLKMAKDMFQVQPLLDKMVLSAKLATNRKSSASVSSGLRAWHGFARAVLDYNERTLPPRCSRDMQRFVVIFKNSGTAANYVGYVNWACKVLDLCTLWRDETVSMVLKGNKKICLQNSSGILKVRVLLDDERVRGIVHLADRADLQELSLATLVWYEFLLRPLSEALVIYFGAPEWTMRLPNGIANGMWVQQGRLYLRLSCRKHRQSGSLLMRQCTCERMKGEQFCVLHRFLQASTNKKPGDVMWRMTSWSTLKQLRTLLKLCKVSGAEQFAWKGFRAGKATAMAAVGDGVGAVLSAGEWKSRAFLSYVDEDTIDKARLLDEMIESSDDDDDEPVSKQVALEPFLPVL